MGLTFVARFFAMLRKFSISPNSRYGRNNATGCDTWRYGVSRVSRMARLVPLPSATENTMLPNMDPLDIYPQYSYNPAPAPPNVDPEGILGWKSVYWDIVPDGTWKRCASPYHYQDRRRFTVSRGASAVNFRGKVKPCHSAAGLRAYTILAEINPFDHFAHEVLMVTFASTIQNAVDNEVRRRLHQQHCIREIRLRRFSRDPFGNLCVAHG